MSVYLDKGLTNMELQDVAIHEVIRLNEDDALSLSDDKTLIAYEVEMIKNRLNTL